MWNFNLWEEVIMNKKLYRVEDNKMLLGVCNNIAEYFDVDPTVVRLVWAFATLFLGAGVLAYVVAAIIMPIKPRV